MPDDDWPPTIDPDKWARAEAEAEWLDLIGAEPNLTGQDECPACDNGPCVWATHIYPQPTADE
jgi:hypothetical protein